MIALIITLIVIVAILLVLLVLAQDPKTGGFQSGAGATQLMGVKKTTDLLERLTWGFIIGVFALAISTSFVIDRGEDFSDGVNSVNIERARQAPNAVQEVPQQGKPTEGQPAQQQINENQPAEKPTESK